MVHSTFKNKKLFETNLFFLVKYLYKRDCEKLKSYYNSDLSQDRYYTKRPHNLITKRGYSAFVSRLKKLETCTDNYYIQRSIRESLVFEKLISFLKTLKPLKKSKQTLTVNDDGSCVRNNPDHRHFLIIDCHALSIGKHAFNHLNQIENNIFRFLFKQYEPMYLEQEQNFRDNYKEHIAETIKNTVTLQ